MKISLLLIIILSAGSLSACENENSLLNDSFQIGISNSHGNENSSKDCCNAICDCFCCTFISVKIEISKLRFLPITAKTIPLLNNKFLSLHFKKHWQPPKKFESIPF